MNKLILIFLLLAVIPFAMAETCIYDESILSKLDGTNIEEQGVAKKLFGKDTAIELVVEDTQEKYYFIISEYVVSYRENEVQENIGFEVTTDSCTLNRIGNGAQPIDEYKERNIKVNGVGVGKSSKVFFGKVGFWFYRVFN